MRHMMNSITVLLRTGTKLIIKAGTLSTDGDYILLEEAKQRVGVFQTGPLGREQQKELVIVMIIIRHRQDRAARPRVGDPMVRYVVGENITDAQVSYAFGEDTRLHGLSFLLQATNLTNSSYRTYAQTKDRPLEFIKWGRTILFGATYKF